MSKNHESILAMKGKLLCNYCNRFIKENEAFKIDEIQYKIYCLECDDLLVISRYSTPFQTPLKLKVYNDIDILKKISKEKENLIGLSRNNNEQLISSYHTITQENKIEAFLKELDKR